MSVRTEIDRIAQNVVNTYSVLETLGCDMPIKKTSDNLAQTAGTAKVVRYDKQTLSEEQKEQARKNIGVSIPTFDLFELGLPAVPLNGTEVSVNIETNEIRESFAKGLVKLKMKLEIFAGSTTDVEGVSNGTYLSFYDSYSCRLATTKGKHYEIRVMVSTTDIKADLVSLGTSGTTEIDEDELREMLEEVLVL